MINAAAWEATFAKSCWACRNRESASDTSASRTESHNGGESPTRGGDLTGPPKRKQSLRLPSGVSRDAMDTICMRPQPIVMQYPRKRTNAADA